MNTLPRTVARKESKRQRTRLANWLREWQIDCLLRSKVSEDANIQTTPAPRFSAPGDFIPRAGQIILLPPVPATQTAGRPIYLLVLKELRDACLVAPFSRFATPAIPGEWKTGLRAKPLRVLCIWNAHLVSGRALSTGWPATITKPQTVELALEMHRHIHADAPLKYVTEQELGPPLQHPLDPRHTYLEEESTLLAEHLAFMETCSKKTSTTFPYEQKPSHLQMAAETRTRYKTKRKKRNNSKK